MVLSNNLFQESSKEDIIKQLGSLEQLCKEAKDIYNSLIPKRDPTDLQHQILLLQLFRVIKYFDAYLMLAKNGYGEPAVNLLRSVFESSLWMRWIIINEDNANKYFNASKGEAIRIMQKLIGRGLATIKNSPDPELTKKMLNDEARNNILPKWEQISDETGMKDMYVLIYKFLSAMSHGSLLFLGERIINKTLSPNSDYDNIESFIAIANNLLRDCFLVSKIWIVEKKIRPAPNVKELIKLRD
jgi:Family of unknown function (DUF5677)